MTENEAIKELQVGYLGDTENLVQAKHIAIKALEENQQYRAIGTVEEFKAMVSENFTKDLLNVGYTKGIKDGYVKAIDEFAERMKQGDVIDYMSSNVRYESIASFIDEIAEEIRGVG